MPSHLIVPLFYYIPKGLLIVSTGLGLMGIREPRHRVLLLGLAFGMSSAVIQGAGLPMEARTVLQWVGAYLVMKYGADTDPLTAATGAALSYYLLSLGRHVLVYPLVTTGLICLSEAPHSSWQTVRHGWLSSLFLVLAMLAVELGFVFIPDPSRGRGPHLRP